jgi:hypothetical protein
MINLRKLVFVLAIFATISAPAAEKVCGVYTSIISFDTNKTIQAAIRSQPSFLQEKHKKNFAGMDGRQAVEQMAATRFNTVFATLYPLWAKPWWNLPAARAMVTDTLKQARGKFRVHLGLSLFNAQFCTEDITRYPGALKTIQCDGTRPDWICIHDDSLWKTYIQNCVEMAKLGAEVPDTLDGIFVDPESYGSECYLCFCDNCVKKFNAWSGESMPTGLEKPDGWLQGKGLWKKYTVDWHDQEVRRHAVDLREAVHKIDPKLQLASLLWDYPVAVGIGDARQGYFRQLAIGLGTKEKPSWVMPEHSYYSDAADLKRIIETIKREIGDEPVQVLPAIRLLRRSSESLLERGEVIRDADVPGYWMYELADIGGKSPIEFEGHLIEPPANYIRKLAEMNTMIEGK